MRSARDASTATRCSAQAGFNQAVEGFEAEYPIAEVKRPDGTVGRFITHSKAVEAKLKRVRRIAGVDAAFMRDHAPRTFKITMPSPSLIARASWRTGLTNQAYPSREALHADVTAIVREEMRALVADGVHYLQLDEGFNAYVNDEWRAGLAAEGRSAGAQLEQDIAADNACYDAVRDAGVTVAMHLCRGSRFGWIDGRGGYEWLAEQLFDRLHADRFLLEYDTGLIGGFEPLRFLPKGKVVVLGLISSKKPQLEHADDILRRIEEAAKVVPIEQLALSTQCGFQGAADRDGAHMTIDEQRRKLELVVTTARSVWG
jgi:5-methyltetrahydropteroyltriglutamate--homocysteine methyltransferase